MAKTSGLVPQFMDEEVEVSPPLVVITLQDESLTPKKEEPIIGYPSRDFHTPLSNHNG